MTTGDAPASDIPAVAPSLARGAAATTVATAVSRVTGFVRVVVVAAAMGTTFLANTYQTANTAPNIVFELLAAGVLTSIFVPTFVDYLVAGKRKEGWEAFNALTSVASVALVGLSVLVALLAPWIMRVLTVGVADEQLRLREISLGSTFIRLFAPQIIFYGVGMVMTAALHAHRRFVLPAVAPIFNNIVVICVYLTYIVLRGDRPPELAGITPAETFVLGAGTTLGVVAMTVCLVPQLIRLGWRFRFRFDLAHPAVRKGARLGGWALSYAGGYQAGLIVVLLLANRVEGGVAAYQWAYTFFYLPHALFAVPIFNALFTAMSEHVARREHGELRGRLQEGLSMLWFLLLPVSVWLIVSATPLARTTLEFGVMTDTGAALVGRVLGAFAIGLPFYSTYLVLTRGYYALGDTRTPALVNVGTAAASSACGALLFAVASAQWRVPGLALGHSLGFAAGAIVLARMLEGKIGSKTARPLPRSILIATAACVVAGLAMAAARVAVPDEARLELLLNTAMTALVGGFAYVAVASWLRSPELVRLVRVIGVRRR